MHTCRLCHFEFVTDDMAVGSDGGKVSICLRCFARETDTARPVPKGLRLEIEATLASLTFI